METVCKSAGALDDKLSLIKTSEDCFPLAVLDTGAGAGLTGAGGGLIDIFG